MQHIRWHDRADTALPVSNAAQRGDHYITLIVDIPTKLNQEQKDALMAYEKALTGNERHGKKKGLFGK